MRFERPRRSRDRHGAGMRQGTHERVEFDETLQRLGPPRSIGEEFGVEFLQASIEWDPYREQWIVHGRGIGGAGRGVYVLGIAPLD